jgi:hypothetical protein
MHFALLRRKEKLMEGTAVLYRSVECGPACEDYPVYQMDSTACLWEEDLFEITEQGQELVQNGQN